MENKYPLKIGVYPSAKLKKDIEKLAKADGRSVNNYVLKLLKDHLQDIISNQNAKEKTKARIREEN